MIGISGQYSVFFVVDKYKDFILEDDLQYFTIIEDAGNVLPTFELEFTLRVNEILRVLNEGNILQVSMGVTSNDYQTFKLRILKKVISKQGDSSYVVKLTGVYDALSYVTNCKVRSGIASGNTFLSGVEVIKKYVSEYFKPIFNIEKSEDKQKWVQYNISDKLHINNIWMHSYIKNSFIATGISSDGQFILKDVRKEVKTTPKWSFSPVTNSTNSILIDPSYLIESNTGFINQWVGYERNKTLFEQDNGLFSSATPDVSPMLTLTKKFDRASVLSNRVDEAGVLNENVHTDYWKAYLSNITNLALFSSTKVTLSFSDIYKPIRVLDLVSFKDEEISGTGASEYHSGLYLISKVARTLSNRKLNTVVILNRETLGNNSGAFK